VLIQHFTMKGRRVPDPLRPGRTAVVGYLASSGNSEVSYADPATGKSVKAHPDDQGWVDVPFEVGTQLCRFRNQGSGFYTPEEIDENVRLGSAERPARPERRPAPKGGRSAE
jgi:hypothetical protein